jgi:hypothetical protein
MGCETGIELAWCNVDFCDYDDETFDAIKGGISKIISLEMRRVLLSAHISMYRKKKKQQLEDVIYGLFILSL